MRLTIDFETKSACDLKKHGAHVYSQHPTTEVLCLAVKEEGTPPFIWKPGDSTVRVAGSITKATEIYAHNVAFERFIWENVCVKRLGWPPLPIPKLRCSMAQACMHALPRSLDEACQALGLIQQKDKIGYYVMMKVCRPRKPRAGEPEKNPNDPYGYYWNNDPADLEKLYKYCMQDTVAEELLAKTLSELPESELAVWRLDQEINARGIPVDIESAKVMIDFVQEHEGILLKRLKELTGGVVKTGKQVEQLGKFLRTLGVDLPDMSAAVVKEALERRDIQGPAREILEIRRSLGRSSSVKYQSIIDRASADERVRGSMIYHGAATGRVAGAGIQPQNFPSRIKVSDDPAKMLEVIRSGGLPFHNALYDDDPMSTAGAVTRSVLMAGPGKELIVADYSAIEGRGLAWLAGEENELENYRSDKDVYISTASMILHKSYDKVTQDERNRIGKVAVLACGYGGSVGAVRKFDDGTMTEDEIKDQIVYPWRDSHPCTTAFWTALNEACFSAIQNPKKIYSARGVSYVVREQFLKCRLPSGRILYYTDPWIAPIRTSWGDIKDSVTYMTVDSMSKKWTRVGTFGGKLAENVTQAICRDIMVLAMLRVEAAGYPVVLTVHDEIVCEVDEGFGSVEEFERIMCEVPAWAKGFPIKAAGWRGKRYKK